MTVMDQSVKLVRKRTFGVRTVEDVRDILGILVKERHTGPVTVNMSQGGIRSVAAEDHASLPEGITAP